MNILIAYATYSGGTQAAAESIAEVLQQHQHTITMKNFKDMQPDDLFAYEAIIWGSNSWLQDGKDGQPHQYVTAFMEQLHERSLQDKPFAVYGLGDSTYARFCGAVNHLERFVNELKGTLIVPSLCIDSYYFEQDKNTDLIKKWAEEIAQKLQ